MSVHEELLYKSYPSRLDYFKRGIQSDTLIKELQQGKKRSLSAINIHNSIHSNENQVVDELTVTNVTSDIELKKQKFQ